MFLLARVTALAGIAMVVAFGVVVALQIATGRIPLAGLLTTKEPGGGRTFSPARLQMLIATLVVAGRYLFLVCQHSGPAALPALPMSAVATLAGSHLTYLGGKAFATYIQPLLKSLK